MKININKQRILAVVVWTLAAAATVTLLGFVAREQVQLNCTGIDVSISGEGNHEFVEREEILGVVNKGGKLNGKPLGSINTGLLEKIIFTNPFVEDVEVYSSVGGKLHIDLIQRHPIVRIMNQNDEQFYIDRRGVFIPLSERYTPPVLVASGYIFNTFAERKVGYGFKASDSSGAVVPRIIDQVYVLAAKIEADTFWRDNAEQIYVNEKQELELIPRAGRHRVLLGDTTSLDDKFARLMVFYQEGLNKTGWNNYSLINLKYRDQVVCTKN